MQLLRYRRSTSAVWAGALFASTLRVAQEFGDHPEAAVARMRWARGVAGEVFASAGPEQDGRRRRPGLRVPGLRRWRLVRI